MPKATSTNTTPRPRATVTPTTPRAADGGDSLLIALAAAYRTAQALRWEFEDAGARNSERPEVRARLDALGEGHAKRSDSFMSGILHAQASGPIGAMIQAEALYIFGSDEHCSPEEREDREFTRDVALMSVIRALGSATGLNSSDCLGAVTYKPNPIAGDVAHAEAAFRALNAAPETATQRA